MRATPLALADHIVRRATEPDQEPALEKKILVLSSLMLATLALIWGAVYFAYGEYRAASVPWLYALLSILSLFLFVQRKVYRSYRLTQLILMLVLPFLLMLTLGGFMQSSAVVLWSLMSPLGALLFATPEQARRLFAVYVLFLITGALWEPFARPANNLPPALITSFFVLNLGGVALVTFVLLAYFARQKNEALFLLGREQARSERLLLNVLPREIAEILKEEPRVIADHYEAASILFADMVGFTRLSEQLPAQEVVTLLNEIFGHFDTLVERYQIEKIRTIGDNYMVAAGVPVPRDDHAVVLVGLALDMQRYLETFESDSGVRPVFRAGINSGPVMAGVIGHKKFQYDVWGDAVNVASRMESHGVPGEIQITQATYELVKDAFECVPRGPVPIKGKGDMRTWQVLGPRENSRS